MCLAGCYELGYDWMECGIKLYDILKRVSCWCCRFKNLKELKAIYYLLPDYWDKLKELQKALPEPMKGSGKSIEELEKRFCKEGWELSLFLDIPIPCR